MLATVLSKQTPVTIASIRSLDAYQDMWNNMILRPEYLHQIEADARLVVKFRKQFELAVTATKIPWQFAGIIYYRECTCSFKGHPHNGDSLKRRTVNVPAGRPLAAPASPGGYTVMESFADLIELKQWDRVPVWNMPSLLYYFESNNGFGYRRLKKNPVINSPYLWSGTQYYESGKFASDGIYDRNLIDQQIGCAPMLRYLTDKTLGIV